MPRDPTTSESYIALRNALLSMQDDESSVLSILSSFSDGGASFVAGAYHELRRVLVQGRLREAEAMGRLIGTVLHVQEQGAADELAENQVHRDAMQWLIDGIGAILSQDNETGIKHLERLTEAIYCNESLQWVAWLWMARAAVDSGKPAVAKRAGDAALRRAADLDSQAQGTTLCMAGEIEFLLGESEAALRHLAEATITFDEIDDRRGKARASLSLARMLARMGRDDEALAAARQAQSADGDWEEPVVFLSERLLVLGRLDDAEQVLRPLLTQEPCAPELRRQEQLVARVRDWQVPLGVVGEYLQLKERPPTEADLPALTKLAKETPRFAPLQELLGWNLLKLNREDEAATHFEALAAQDLDPEVQASVLLGLGCLANRRHRNRQSAARVHAAVSASLQPISRTPTPVAAPVFAPSKESGLDFDIDLDADDLTPPPAVGPPQAGAPAAVAHLEAAAVPASATVALPTTLAPPTPAAPPPAAPPGPSVAPPAAPTPAAKTSALAAPAAPKSAAKAATGSHGAVPPSSSKAVFTGDLQLFAVPDLLDFLKNSRRTGTLVITSDRGIGAVHMRNGMLTGAASPQGTNMGEILLRQGSLTEERLREAMAQQRDEKQNQLLGAILVDRGFIQAADLQRALTQQIRSAIREMVEWTAGRFAFEPDKHGQADSDPEISVELDTQAVLLDVLREMDEESAGPRQDATDAVDAIDSI